MSASVAAQHRVGLGSRHIILLSISALFMLWGFGFIYRSSAVAIDGRRYFSLIDDAMISMRYAWNLTHGAGLVWNAGERVEGYSNLLMVLWMALPTAILDKSAAVLAVQLSGIGMMLATAWTTMNIGRLTTTQQMGQHAQAIELLAYAAPLAYYPLVFWSLMGMETGLLALLLGSAILASLNYARDGQARHLAVIGGALGLAYLTRNDSAIFGAVIFAYVLAQSRGSWIGRLKSVRIAALIYAGIIALQAGFRLAYYGSLWPNTYFLKLVGMPLDARLENGAGFLAPFMLEAAPLLVATALGVIWRPSRNKLYLGSFLIVALAYEMYAGGDYSNYWRFMAPVLPLWAVILAQSLSEFVAAPTGRSETTPPARGLHPARVAGLVVAGVAALLLLSTDRRFLGEMVLPRSLADATRDYVDLSVAIDAATKPGASVGVIRAGIIPYYTGKIGVDFLGKTDPYIARLAPDLSGQISWNGMSSVSGHNKYDLDYSIKERLPTYVEGFEWGAQNLNEWGGQNYVNVRYKGMRLSLLRDSPLVNWDEVKVMDPG